MNDEIWERIMRGLHDAEVAVKLNKEVAEVYRLESVGQNVMAVELLASRQGWSRFVDLLLEDKFSVKTQGWRSVAGSGMVVYLYVSVGKPRTDFGGRSPFDLGRGFFKDEPKEDSR